MAPTRCQRNGSISTDKSGPLISQITQIYSEGSLAAARVLLSEIGGICGSYALLAALIEPRLSQNYVAGGGIYWYVMYHDTT